MNSRISSELKESKDDPLRYTARIEDFDIEVVLVCNDGPSFKAKGDLYKTQTVTVIYVSVSRDEESAPLDVHVLETGESDLKERVSWIDHRRDDYRRIALEAANRVIRFFRYEMRTPRLQEFSVLNNDFRKPRWTDRNGEEIQTGVFEFVVTLLSPQALSYLERRILRKPKMRS